MLPTRNFKLLVVNALHISLRNPISPSNFKIDLEVPKVSEKLEIFF